MHLPGSELKQINAWLASRQCHEEKDGITFVDGTCDWILGREELRRWLKPDGKPLLWLHGIPGCGKSFLYAKVVNHLQELARRGAGPPCVYFFFCGADKERVTTAAVLRSWIMQLARAFPSEVRDIILATARASENTRASDSEVKTLFVSLFAAMPPCYLTVDALDECVDWRALVALLRSGLRPDCKLLVTSRTMPQLATAIRHAMVPFESLEITEELSRPDIERYVEHELAEYNQRLTRIGDKYDEEFAAAFRTRLVADCGGMFLWVRLMSKHVWAQPSPAEALACLADLPQTLSAQYDRVIARINADPEPSRRLLAHKVFWWMGVARRPLEIRELCALLAVRPADLVGDRLSRSCNGFDAARRIGPDPHARIMEMCDSLIVARMPPQKNGDSPFPDHMRTLYPIHFTATEYLAEYLRRSDTLAELTAYYDVRQLQSSDALAAAVCTWYLSLDAVAVKLDGVKVESHADAVAIFAHTKGSTMGKGTTNVLDALRYATSHWHHHMRRAWSTEQPARSGQSKQRRPKEETALLLDIATSELSRRREAEYGGMVVSALVCTCRGVGRVSHLSPAVRATAHCCLPWAAPCSPAPATAATRARTAQHW